MFNLTTYTSYLIALPGKLRRTSPLSILTYSLILFSVIGFGFSILAFISTGYKDGLFLAPFCFNNTCVKNFTDGFSQAFTLAKATLDFLVAIATTGGIVVALMSYLNSASTTALTNHIAHFSIFQNYVINEISKRSRISPTSIDTLVWYNIIFSTSRSGKTDVSSNYIAFVNELNLLIKKSNIQAERAIEGSFRYKQHQERIREQLKKSGMEIFFCPRNDFFEMEGQLFSLIDRINQSFCYSSKVPALLERKYI